MNEEVFQPDTENTEWNYARDIGMKTPHSFFVTGKAGTGKSTLIKNIKNSPGKNFIVLAPTGLAAVQAGGSTIHSFFRLPFNPLPPGHPELLRHIAYSAEKRKLIQEASGFIIDEISMVRADVLDAVDYMIRRTTGIPYPFGGKQIILSGDVFQLEPVAPEFTGERAILENFYQGMYFFNSLAFQEYTMPAIELLKIYRQTDAYFIGVLNRIRMGWQDDDDLGILNERVHPHLEELSDRVITLCTRNAIAERINLAKLNDLPDKEFIYEAEIKGKFEENMYPVEYLLALRKGARVIFTRNDPEHRWVNGTSGRICELTPDTIKVEMKSGEVHTLQKEIWTNYTYVYDKQKKSITQEETGRFIQYPVRLAWAVTIHKSQGMAFEEAIINFGSGTFASGQAYVALSRCTSLEGIYLKNPIRHQDIIVDDQVKRFAKTFNDTDLLNELLRG